MLEAEARKPYMPAARIRAMGGYEEPVIDWEAHAAENARIRATGHCGDCGQPLTAPGAPGICAAGHTPAHDPEDTALD